MIIVLWKSGEQNKVILQSGDGGEASWKSKALCLVVRYFFGEKGLGQFSKQLHQMMGLGKDLACPEVHSVQFSKNTWCGVGSVRR